MSRHFQAKRQFEEVFRKGGIAPESLSQGLYREVISTQNRGRGTVFESVGQALACSLITGRGLDPSGMAVHRAFGTPQGRRFADLFFPVPGWIVEIKSGHVTLSQSVRRQIAKDKGLKGSDPLIAHAVWLLFRGASDAVLDELRAADIDFFDIQWDKQDTDNPDEPREYEIIRA